MKSFLKKSTTLLELIVALVLMGLLILAFANIDFFSRFHTITADRRAKVLNEVTYILEHMAKRINWAIGNPLIDGEAGIVDLSPIDGDYAVRIYIDAGDFGDAQPGNGTREETGAGTTDHWIAYRCRSTGDPLERYQLWYYAKCTNPNNCQSDQETVISSKVSAFNMTYDPPDNYVFVNLTACWNPNETSHPCGTAENPNATMCTRIRMPSVSTN